VALSANGDTALIGGPRDDSVIYEQREGLRPARAAWAFTRSSSIWSQQGEKLGIEKQQIERLGLQSERLGQSVAISSNGNIALPGAPDASLLGPAAEETGSAWVFARNGSM